MALRGARDRATKPSPAMGDKQERPYPAWWSERAAARELLLDRAVARLRDYLPSVPGVRAALVFGSYARKSVGPESDLDIMLIRDTEEPPLRRADDVYADMNLGVPFDLVVYTPAEFERLRRERPFVEQAAREGLWIDAAPSR
jgi:predicted nucleotidyltransferase